MHAHIRFQRKRGLVKVLQGRLQTGRHMLKTIQERGQGIGIVHRVLIGSNLTDDHSLRGGLAQKLGIGSEGLH